MAFLFVIISFATFDGESGAKPLGYMPSLMQPPVKTHNSLRNSLRSDSPRLIVVNLTCLLRLGMIPRPPVTLMLIVVLTTLLFKSNIILKIGGLNKKPIEKEKNDSISKREYLMDQRRCSR